MAKVLGEGVNVILTHPETQEPVTFMGGKYDDAGEYVKGATLPGWAEDKVGDHALEGYVKPKSSLTYSNPDSREAKAAAAGGSGSGDGPPPMGGTGSGVDAWTSYATGLGLEVEDGSSRDEVVQLVESGGYPTTRES